MRKDLKKIPTRNMSRDEWLEQRRKSIGGSDASAIVGMNSFSSPYTVWADKLEKIPPKEDSEAMRLGRDLEEYVVRRFTEKTGKRLRRENNILINPTYPFAHANVDRMVVGEDAGFEAKTTSVLNMGKFKNGEYPENYYVQCVHYMAVTGCKRWYLGVLVLGVEFKWFVIERDEDEIKALMNAEREFWKHVTSKTPPIADGDASTSETIQTIYRDDDGSSVSLTGYQNELNGYMETAELIKGLEAKKTEYANRIKAFMGESAKGECDGYSVSWATQSRRTFDYNKFAADNPEMDLSGYFKNSQCRTFRVNKL